MTVSVQRPAPLQRPVRLGYLARQVIGKALDDNVLGLAAQLAFFSVLAVFPFLLLLATLLPYITQPDALDRLMTLLEPVVPPRALGLVQDNLHTLLTKKREGLLSFSAVALLWSSSSGFAAVMDGLNVAYRVRESRPFWRARPMAVGLTLVLGLLVLVSIVLLVFGEWLSGLAAEHVAFPVIFWGTIRWVVALTFLVLALDIIYYTAPNVRHRWRWLSPGAMLATPAWVAMSLGFSFYISRFARYEATYGALAAVISLMLWFYASGVVLLLGGELNAVVECGAEREETSNSDTTQIPGS